LSKSKNGKINESKNVSVLILIFKKYFYTSLYSSLFIPGDKPDKWAKKKASVAMTCNCLIKIS